MHALIGKVGLATLSQKKFQSGRRIRSSVRKYARLSGVSGFSGFASNGAKNQKKMITKVR